MRISYATFVGEAEGWTRTLRQFAFVALTDPPLGISPLFPEPRRVWAVVDDLAVITRMRASITPASCVYADGQPRRIDYDPDARPTLIIHDVE